MRTSHIFAAIVGAPWALLALMGISAVQQAKLQELPPDMIAGRAGYYLHLPLAVLVVVIGAWLISRYRPIRFVAYAAYALATIVLPCYLLFYTGGM